jgi:agmatinase
MTEVPSHLGLIAMPFEASTSFLKGCVLGPTAILSELETMDTYELRLGRDPFEGVSREQIHAHDEVVTDARLQQAFGQQVVEGVLARGGFPLSLGGEHTISLGPIKAARARGPLGIVQLDAHADLRDSYEGNPFSHASVMRRAVERGCQLLSVGVRAVSAEEDAIARKSGVAMVGGRITATRTGWYSLVEALPERVYLTIDMDVFDPQEVPGVGTPEPGGPGFEPVASFLAHLFAVKNVVAADIVELRPVEGDAASVRAAARLVGLITGYRFGA